MQYKISICIPTYNRAKYLTNCLDSIIHNKTFLNQNIEVCVSDNCSQDETKDVVAEAKKKIDINYNRNKNNLGIPKNFIKVVDMAKGEFIWLIGDDDLLMPDALYSLNTLIDNNKGIDFFYVNSYHLSSEYVFSYDQPFNIKDLPEKMEKFSNWSGSGPMPFLDLVNPKISFDFLGGMFLSVFRRKNWCEHITALDNDALNDSRTFSHFDNTFPHVKIFSKAFSNSMAYYNKTPLNICLYGAREWEPMYNFIKSVRLIEALDNYRENGLSLLKYIYCKNFALRSFIPNLIYMYLNKETSGYKFVNPVKLIARNCVYPNFYFSIIYFMFRRLNKIIKSLANKLFIFS